MAKKTTQSPLSLLQPRASEGFAWGWPAGDVSLEAVSSQPQGCCKSLPQGLERLPSPVHAWMGARPKVGRSCSGALSLHPPPPLEAGVGESGAGESNKHTATHSEEARLFRKGCSGDPWHSAGRPGLCNTARRTQTLERGRPVPPTAIPEPPGHSCRAERQTSGSPVGSLGGAGLPFFGLGVEGEGRAREGEPRRQGQAGRARPS